MYKCADMYIMYIYKYIYYKYIFYIFIYIYIFIFYICRETIILYIYITNKKNGKKQEMS